MVGIINKSSKDQPKTYTLLGADNISYVSEAPGLLGGNSKSKIYGRFDCSAAIRAKKMVDMKNIEFFLPMRRLPLQQVIDLVEHACASSMQNGKNQKNKHHSNNK
ncbi:hypothetical protein [Neobacillus drentensis]|uniref:hypothetical protein n=1 Tax=Neobacillus drentensis TaxID=220684 RepID=UPI003F68987C